MRGRFAPSPTGRMHLGNIWAALLNWLYIRAHGGEIALRIEDIDRARCREEYVDQLLLDMELLGLDWDGEAVLQSAQRNLHYDIVEDFRARGLTYPCYCSRADLHSASAPHAEDGLYVYDGRCKNLRGEIPGRAYALRLELPDREISHHDAIHGWQQANLARDIGDIVIWRKDNTPSYALACAADDALMQVDLVIRGRDLLSSAFSQIYIAGLLGKPAASYMHIPLLIGRDGRRLSKRHASFDLGAMLQSGYRPGQITGLLGYYAGLLEEPAEASPRELLGIIAREGWPLLPTEDIRITEMS